MKEDLLSLRPEKVWKYFSEILDIPRPSKKESRIASYLTDFGNQQGLVTIQDKTGNILIRKGPSKGMENRKTVVLQSHMDMVGEKNSDVDHDFEADSIKAYVDGGWVRARGTTLGADDGIGIAVQLAILSDNNLCHGPIECLFTVDEETGLTGAFGLESGLLKGTILLNLDSEDDGELFIGCAGGIDTVVTIPSEWEEPGPGHSFYEIALSGLTGGHSGDDIHKGRANAVKLMNRLLWNISREPGIRLAGFDGGNLRNAIAREAVARVAVERHQGNALIETVNKYAGIFRSEYRITEPGLRLAATAMNGTAQLLKKNLQESLLNAVYACPHGVISWSAEIAGFVETSTNLASIRTGREWITITTSQRSSVETAKNDIKDMVGSAFRLAGGDIAHSEGYPGWTPNRDSQIVAISKAAYMKMFGSEPVVRAIHAGLECGVIGSKYPGMDMVSYGPTIRGAHSPDEKLEIHTVGKFWDLTLEILRQIPEKD